MRVAHPWLIYVHAFGVQSHFSPRRANQILTAKRCKEISQELSAAKLLVSAQNVRGRPCTARPAGRDGIRRGTG